MKSHSTENHRPIRIDEDRKVRFKMYKNGKKWAFAGLATTFFMLLPFMETNSVQAAEEATDATPSTSVQAQSDSSTGNTAAITTPKITNAKATTATDGTVTITGQTTAGAKVTATTSTGETTEAEAAADGQFSIELKATGTVELSAALNGETSTTTAVEVPEAAAASATATTPATTEASAAATEATTTSTAEPAAATETKTPATADATSAKAQTATTAESTAAATSSTTPASNGELAASTDTTAAEATATATTEATAPTETTGTAEAAIAGTAANTTVANTTTTPALEENVITLVEPTTDELNAAKALAAEQFKKTGQPQTIRVVAAGAQSSFKATTIKITTNPSSGATIADDDTNGQGEAANDALPSGNYTNDQAPTKALITVDASGATSKTVSLNDSYVSVYIPKVITVATDGQSQVSFTLSPYAILAGVAQQGDESFDADDVQEALKGIDGIKPVQTPSVTFTAKVTPATDGGSIVSMQITDIGKLQDLVVQGYQDAITAINAAYTSTDIPGLTTLWNGFLGVGIGPFFNDSVNRALKDPATLLSNALYNGAISDVNVTLPVTLSVAKGTSVVEGEGAQSVKIFGAVTNGSVSSGAALSSVSGMKTATLYYANAPTMSADDLSVKPDGSKLALSGKTSTGANTVEISVGGDTVTADVSNGTFSYSFDAKYAGQKITLTPVIEQKSGADNIDGESVDYTLPKAAKLNNLGDYTYKAAPGTKISTVFGTLGTEVATVTFPDGSTKTVSLTKSDVQFDNPNGSTTDTEYQFTLTVAGQNKVQGLVDAYNAANASKPVVIDFTSGDATGTAQFSNLDEAPMTLDGTVTVREVSSAKAPADYNEQISNTYKGTLSVTVKDPKGTILATVPLTSSTYFRFSSTVNNVTPGETHSPYFVLTDAGLDYLKSQLTAKVPNFASTYLLTGETRLGGSFVVEKSEAKLDGVTLDVAQNEKINDKIDDDLSKLVQSVTNSDGSKGDASKVTTDKDLSQYSTATAGTTLTIPLSYTDPITGETTTGTAIVNVANKADMTLKTTETTTQPGKSISIDQFVGKLTDAAGKTVYDSATDIPSVLLNGFLVKITKVTKANGDAVDPSIFYIKPSADQTLTLNNGVIDGAYAVAGDYTVALTYTDSATGKQITKTVTMHVTDATALETKPSATATPDQPFDISSLITKMTDVDGKDIPSSPAEVYQGQGLTVTMTDDSDKVISNQVSNDLQTTFTADQAGKTYTVSFAYSVGGKTVKATTQLTVGELVDQTINYVDVVTGKTIATDTISGAKDSSQSYTARLNDLQLATGVTGTYNENTTDYSDANGKVIDKGAATPVEIKLSTSPYTIYVTHTLILWKATPSVTATWTINYDLGDETKVDPKTQIADWYQVKDQVTGNFIYTQTAKGLDGNTTDGTPWSEVKLDSPLADGAKYVNTTNDDANDAIVTADATVPVPTDKNAQTFTIGGVKYVSAVPTNVNYTAHYQNDKTTITPQDISVPAGTLVTGADFVTTDGKLNPGAFTDKAGNPGDPEDLTITWASAGSDSIVDGQFDTTDLPKGEYQVALNYGEKTVPAKVTVTDNATAITVSDKTVVRGQAFNIDQMITQLINASGQDVTDTDKGKVTLSVDGGLDIPADRTITAEVGGVSYRIIFTYQDHGVSKSAPATLTVIDNSKLSATHVDAKVGDTISVADFDPQAIGPDGTTPLEGGDYSITALVKSSASDKSKGSAVLDGGTIKTTGDTAGAYTVTIAYVNGDTQKTTDVTLTITDETSFNVASKSINVGDAIAESDFYSGQINAHGDTSTKAAVMTGLTDATDPKVTYTLAEAAAKEGNYNLTFVFSDGGKAVSQSTTLTVTDKTSFSAKNVEVTSGASVPASDFVDGATTNANGKPGDSSKVKIVSATDENGDSLGLKGGAIEATDVGTYTVTLSYTDGGKTATKTATLNVIAQSSLIVTYHDQTTGEVIGTKKLEGGEGKAYDGFTATIDQMKAADGVDGSKYTEATTDYVTADGEPTDATEVPAGTFDGSTIDVYVKHVLTESDTYTATWTIKAQTVDGVALGSDKTQTATGHAYTDAVTGAVSYKADKAFTDETVEDFSKQFATNPTIDGTSVAVGSKIAAKNPAVDADGYMATAPTDATTTVVYTVAKPTLSAEDTTATVGSTVAVDAFKPSAKLGDADAEGTFTITGLEKTKDQDT
ncbi:KxYKxGKxW signal peptide domain-containing protein, partial [Lacticaseibacillus nasuensis]|uniref:KxYKxGKxW signal peptide domain-containing protein n=1 Tax=Lacticaseibacillus nasuensis TaxID=944671 RepID=UPI002246C548